MTYHKVELALERLNEQQRDAVMHRHTPMLIKALAGSGKTNVLTCRAAKLIALDNIKPSDILMVTFTKKAAQEMQNRIMRLLNQDPSDLPQNWITMGTFHHVGVRILRRYAHELTIDKNFTILDQDEVKYLVKGLFKENKIKKGEYAETEPLHSPDTFINMYSLQVNEMEDPMTQLPLSCKGDSQALTRKIIERFREEKRKHNTVDYDDILIYWNDLLEHPRTADEISTNWSHVLVDEYQDTNVLQEAIISKLTTNELCVVGDTHQSIYGWRGAKPKHMITFQERYPQTHIFPLEVNYRSTPEILAAANSILAAAGEQHRLKPHRNKGVEINRWSYQNEYAEADMVAQQVKKLIQNGTDPKQICILSRTSNGTMLLEHYLTNTSILFEKRGGIKISDRKEIKDCLAIARIILNPKDQAAWLRALQLYPRIGQAKANAIFETWLDIILDEEDNHIPAEANPRYEEIFTDNDKKNDGIRHLFELVIAYRDTARTDINPVIEGLWLEWKRLAPENYEKENLEERQEMVQKELDYWKKSSDLANLITNMALSKAEEDERMQTELAAGKQRVIISTIHSAKGLEWKNVFFIGTGARQLPHMYSRDTQEEIEEERRLVYVAITRAMDTLTITFPRVVKDRNETAKQNQTTLIIEKFKSL